MKQILSTKVLDEKDIALAASLGLQVTCANFTEIVPMEYDANSVSKDFDAVGFTSYNAVVSFLSNPEGRELLNGKPVYGLSGRTSEELTKQGIPIVAVSNDGVSLAKEVIWNKSLKSVLHVCGNLVMEKMGEKIQAFGIGYKRLEVYKTILTPKSIERKFDAIFFFSPSGINSFLQKNELPENTVLCCIGNTTAEVLRNQGGQHLLTPTSPSPIAMITELAQWYKTNDQCLN